MKIEILKQKETPLLKRKRVNCMVDFAGATPDKTALREDLSKQLKVDKQLIAVRHVYQRYGLPRAKVIVHVYKDFETLKKREMLSDKKLKGYEEKPVEAPKEEVKAEAPKEAEKPVEAKEDGKEENKE